MARPIAYYNEFDPQAAAWLRELIAEGLIPPGDVDERSIEDVRPSDLHGYAQCHFFAGIGGWPHALRLAGWREHWPVWTGSCPCQPFSAAGKRGGADDPRALWWAFRWLIDQCRPAVVFGEQVASKAGRLWLAGVRADLEALGYAVGAADLCAAGVGAPHIRQRLWWVAESVSGQRHRLSGTEGCHDHWAQAGRQQGDCGPSNGGQSRGGRLGHPSGAGAGRHRGAVPGAQAQGERGGLEPGRVGNGAVDAGADGGVGDPGSAGREEREGDRRVQREAGQPPSGQAAQLPSDPWANAVWIPCADGKARRIKLGLEPLVDGLPGRVGLLRGYGNAIVPQVAAEVILAYREIAQEHIERAALEFLLS